MRGRGKGNLWADGYVHYLDSGDVCMGVYISQNLSMVDFKRISLLYASYTSTAVLKQI